MTDPTRLLETMRAVEGTSAAAIPLWPRHRARLASAAAAFGVPLDLGRVDAALADALDAVRQPMRVRLTVGAAGDARVDVSIPTPPPATVWLDPEPFVDAGSHYCIHKTTQRAHYDARLDRAIAQGADDALLVGPDGALVEATRASLWVARDGRFLTPPLAAGGLPGVMRAHLLATRRDTAEARLTPADLLSADGIWLSNAVIGLVPVCLLPTP